MIWHPEKHDIHLVLMYNGKRILIDTEEYYFDRSPARKKEYREFFTDGDKYGRHFDDEKAALWMIAPCIDAIQDLSPDPITTLGDYYNAEVIIFQVHATTEDKLVIETVNHEKSKPWPSGNHSEDALSSKWPSWPLYDLKDVRVHHDQTDECADKIPSRVSVDGEQMLFFKPFDHGFDAITNVIRTYEKIRDAGLTHLRLPALHGIVGEEKKMFGLLLSFIPSDGKRFGRRTRHANASLRQRWASQLMHTVHELHKANITWGHAKTCNVMIDKEDNAWIVGVGGGHIQRAIGCNFANDIEGDLRGMSNILALLNAEGSDNVSTNDSAPVFETTHL